MMKHFKKLGAPLYSIHEYPSLCQQEQRFKNAGWAQARARNLWDLWSDDEFLPSSTRASLDAVETFDEWEELALYASHYFLLHASTRNPTDHGSGTVSDNTGSQASVSAQYTLIPHCPSNAGQRRFGALIPDSDRSLGHHGGLGRQTRLASTSLYSQSEEVTNPNHTFPSRDITARMCHTATTLKDNDCLLAGGRTSPASGFQDCWLRQGNRWQPVHSLPEPRFRHNAVKVTVTPDDSSDCVLIYGGKTSNGQVLDTWILWCNNGRGWQTIETNGQTPRARFGACLEIINGTTGVLFGGIGKENVILEDFWTWTLCQRIDGTFYLDFTDHTESLRKSPLFDYTSRFGATINHTGRGLLIAGGIIPRRVVPADKELLLLNSTELLNCLQTGNSWSSSLISAVGLGVNFQGSRPLLTGHAASAVDSEQILILGGGAVCFSFGTFWTEGTWLLKPVELNVESKWALVPESVQPEKSSTPLPSTSQSSKLEKVKDVPVVPRVQVQDPAQFQQILADGKPVVIEGSDIGPCTELWTKDYMTNAVGSDHKV